MKKILIAVFLLVFIFVGTFVVLILNSPSTVPKPPYFIPSPDNAYTIIEEDGIFYLPTVIKNREIKVPIGKSNISLKNYVGKKIN